MDPEKSSQFLPQKDSPFMAKFLAVFLIVFLFFISLSAVFLIYQNRQLKKQLSSISQIPPISPISPIPSEIPSDWKTYTNEEYGFEFKYPQSLYLFESNNKNAIAILGTVQLKSLPFEGPEGSIVIGFNECTNTVTNEKWPCQGSIVERIADMKGIDASKSLYISKEYNLGGRIGAQISGFPEGPAPMKETMVPYNNYLLLIRLFQKDFEQTYDQILSTFHFLK